MRNPITLDILADEYKEALKKANESKHYKAKKETQILETLKEVYLAKREKSNSGEPKETFNDLLYAEIKEKRQRLDEIEGNSSLNYYQKKQADEEIEFIDFKLEQIETLLKEECGVIPMKQDKEIKFIPINLKQAFQDEE